ncbi:MAG: M15 family metallopeptidase [Marmoricola sp.]
MPFPSTPLSRIVVPLLVVAAALVGPAGPASADTTPSTLTLSAPASGKAGTSVPFTATLTDAGSAPIVGATVTLRRTGPSPAVVGSGTTNGSGVVVINATRPAGTSTWQSSYAGDTVHAAADSDVASITGRRYASTVRLTGPARLVDERTATLSVLWTAADSSNVSGVVTIQRKLRSGPWTVARRLRTNTAGRVAFAVRPRVDSQWRAVGAGGPWWLTDASPVLAINNVPPISPASYPKAAPRPRATPAQSRATGQGANAVVSRIPNGVWKSMTGRSWHRGCPVGRAGLRLVRINYWGFDGYRYRGEMVLATAAARRAAAALADMYAGRYPIRRMYRVDRFGWSKKLRGANDYASMRADNTSAFNCRQVVNKPGVMSPHARGRAVDINTWENPYRSATGLVPNSWWHSRSHPKYAWRSSSHAVVRIWGSHGFRWTYGTGDSQHVDGRNGQRAVPTGSFIG